MKQIMAVAIGSSESWVGETFTAEGTCVIDAGFTTVLPHLAMPEDNALPQVKFTLGQSTCNIRTIGPCVWTMTFIHTQPLARRVPH